MRFFTFAGLSRHLDNSKDWHHDRTQETLMSDLADTRDNIIKYVQEEKMRFGQKVNCPKCSMYTGWGVQ